MANFYPSVTCEEQDFHSSQGEQLVYRALQKLNNEYSVIHSYRWLGHETQIRSEGEADFLILHPAKGILSLEVKAGGIGLSNGSWIQINRNTGTEKIIDPFGQAAESQYRVRTLLRDSFRYPAPLVGRAVWFTSICVGKNIKLPPEAVPDIILDQDSLERPEEDLDKAFSYWRKNLRYVVPPLTGGQFRELIHVLLPSFRIAETVSCCAEEQKADYVRLTRQQFAVLDFLQEQRTAVIHGPAGTGKSLLGVEKARRLARQGKKVLFLCFNEFLYQHLRGQERDPLITFHNVRSLAEEILQDNTLPLCQVNAFFEEYFARVFDDREWPYPNIVVDEGQDISGAMLEHLAFLAELNEGCFYVFYDRNQFILANEPPEWLDKNVECRLVLYRNCRNTTEIASSVGTLVQMKRERYVNDVHGSRPKAVFCKDGKEMCQAAEKFVRDMLQQRIKPEDMVILSVHSIGHSALCEVKQLGGLSVSLTQEPGKIWFSTVRKFKGLEARAVLVVDIEVSRLNDPVMRRMLYIGGSRANSYLKVAFLDDVEQKEYREIVNTLAAEQCGRQNDPLTGDDIQGPVSCAPLCPQGKVSLSGTRKSIVKLLGMESE